MFGQPTNSYRTYSWSFSVDFRIPKVPLSFPKQALNICGERLLTASLCKPSGMDCSLIGSYFIRFSRQSGLGVYLSALRILAPQILKFLLPMPFEYSYLLNFNSFSFIVATLQLSTQTLRCEFSVRKAHSALALQTQCSEICKWFEPPDPWTNDVWVVGLLVDWRLYLFIHRGQPLSGREGRMWGLKIHRLHSDSPDQSGKTGAEQEKIIMKSVRKKEE